MEERTTEQNVDRGMLNAASLVAMTVLMESKDLLDDYLHRSEDFAHMDIYEFTADCAARYGEALERRLRQ